MKNPGRNPRNELERLREENRRLQVLLHFAQNLQAHLELDKLLLTTMEEVARIMEADRCSVFLLDEEANELWSVVAMGIERGKEIRFPADRGIAGYVATTGEVLNIPDAYQDPRFNPEIDRKTGYRTRNMLTMPLKNKQNEIIGVFQVLNKREGQFSEKDVELLQAISHIASTAIENSFLYKEQVESLNSFVETLSATLDTRDYITAGHSRRVTLYAMALCQQMAMDDDCCEQLRYAALLHDIGKIGIPEVVLFKAGSLEEEEYELIKKHPAITRRILGSIRFPRKLKMVPDIASTHHEKVNGQGYPDGLKDSEIPLGGKILALVDVFDALTSRRQYKDREPIEKVWRIIEQEAGKSFDRELIDHFQRLPTRRILEILHTDKLEWKPESDGQVLASIPFHRMVALKRKSPEQLKQPEKKILQLFDKYYWDESD